MIDSLFYSSMSNVLTQWSDFKVSKNLYKAYFDMQKTETTKGSTRREINYKNTFNKDRLGSLTEGVSSAVKNLESAFAEKEDGEIDKEKAYSAAEKFVKSYNELVSNIKKSGNAQIAGKQEFIANMATAYSKRLENVGITIGEDGKLSIDKDDFMSAGAGDYGKIFGKDNSFASFMSSQAEQLSKINTSQTSNTASYTSSGTKKNTLSSGDLMNMLK